MKVKQIFVVIVFTLLSARIMAHNEAKQVEYKSGDVTCKGYVAYDAHKSKMPVVLIIHEWWGCNDYVQMRANMLASLGYFAFAVDMYGNGIIATTPQEAQEYSTKIYSNSALMEERIQAAIDKLKDFPMADVNNMAAIGYCFGGSMVLNAAKLRMPFKAVVSFHGGLEGDSPKGDVKSKILVCNGASDKFVSSESIAKFKEEMNKAHADLTFIDYPDATHAFTNPAATEIGKKFNMPITYNATADKKSWDDMKDFLAKILLK
ncbi:MAG: dienelactone hydrolase family protein [Bacteroidetes bacterium]|jgi:dienelactone hydrolase|nr:dienelactone hydrolase family protein [Bacteroidota bacterium]